MDRYHIKALLACSLITCSTISYADDSEIFFSKDLTGTKPNIIFLLDTSGSMGGSLGSNTNGYARTRMQVLQDSMEEILMDEGIKNVRMGIMSFASSTSKRQEVVDIDEIDPSKDTITKVDSGNVGYKILTQPILVGYDDGTSITTNTTVTTSLTSSSGSPSTTVYAAFRFNNILVKNSTTNGINPTVAIKKAELKFRRTSATATTYTIKVDSAIDAPFLRIYANYMKERASLTGTTTLSCSTGSGVTSYDVTCDVTDVIRNKISQTNWKDGNAIAFYITSSPANTIYFHEVATAAYRPKLEIEVANELVADNNKTYRDQLAYKVFELYASGGTAIVGGMLDVAKYVSNVSKSYSTTTKGPYHVASWGTTPLQEGCQLTHLVLMTDGEAGTSGASATRYYMSGTTSACPIYTDVNTTISDPGTGAEQCGRALASWMARHSQSDFPGGNFIRTHAVGFTLSTTSNAQKFVNDLASYGMGKSFNASNATELTEAFKDIVGGALLVDSLSASGQVTTSAENSHDQRREVYYALYKSENYDYWPGNMKGFFLEYISMNIKDKDGKDKEVERPVLRDKNNVSAMGTDGIIKNTVSSRWANSNSDGGSVEAGGVLAMLKTPATRNVFTIKNGGVEQLNASSNITIAELGITSGATEDLRKGLLDFIRGYTYVLGGSSEAGPKKLGDAVKGNVALATYGCNTADKDIWECEADRLSQVALLASNDGFIRGYDVTTGEAIYEYMPYEMLPLIHHLHTRKKLTINEVRNYGMDSKVAIYHDDTNSDSFINNGEDAFAYITNGRGGQYIYAIDISNKNSPKLAWQISNKTVGFEKLGDAWSAPVTGKINIDGTITPVVIFGGGYDKSQDDQPNRSTDTVGNGLYIVNAKTGQRIWSTTANMNYSIPSAVGVVRTPVDSDVSVITDIFVGDMGGQLWRFQVNNGNPLDSLVVAAGGNKGIIANFADNTVTNSRKFYYAPVITKFSSDKNKDLLSVSIGSGYRAHPLSTEISDRIYSLRVPKQANLSDTKVITESDLAVTSTDGKTVNEGNKLENGFVIRLGIVGNADGEKMISDGAADFERIVFNTYIPTKSVTTNCVPGTGTQRTYNFYIDSGLSALETPYYETSVSTLPPDVATYCNGDYCTFIPAPEFLAEESFPGGTDGGWFGEVNGGTWKKLAWTDVFNLDL